MARTVFTEEHEEFRSLVKEFLAREVEPHAEDWEAAGIVDKSVYKAAAQAGVLGFSVPEAYGGMGIDDFRYNAIVAEELARGRGGGVALTLLNDIVAPYLLRLTTEGQRQRWLTALAAGDMTFAIAMSEPGAGSDLAGIRTSAVREGDEWVISGQKTFISNGILSDAVIVVCRTDPEAGHKGFSLIVVEDGTPGFERGRKLKKMGHHAQDTAELFFSECRVPAGNLLGTEGRGFFHLMENLPSERLSIAVSAIAAAEKTFAETMTYAKEREAFGQPIGSFQANRFTIAEMATELDIARIYVDSCIDRVVDGTLTAVDAAKAKWWCTELHKKVVDQCLQLHGGYGYMLEYPVARAYQDVRISTILGGTTEIMKEIIGRDLGF
ncbi:acyl-CoA dehydrogenase family protein [Nocardioides panzhihuensis]|uniref:Acyl-[acyl-carrier-protein] dehydrogenase MbtN n=1 Tax=Nocardioides panzhihuensis TaxID=860243 RepID=A0A7Z0IQ76_9ACTN|nr:acyl-CoA dehydrogenase family protein [Nocardioides panzhihuensis]NYI75513.1 acyl-CoA dehydrogenase [Nocardioides panzhihuensis]